MNDHDRELAGAFAAAGLSEITLIEETYDLDFDEWIDRGSPDDSKEDVRAGLLTGPPRARVCPDAARRWFDPDRGHPGDRQG
jgi:hypothetical protein